LERFNRHGLRVGVRLSGDRLRIDAPFGLDDVFAMRLRPNPIRKTTGFEQRRIGATALAGGDERPASPLS